MSQSNQGSLASSVLSLPVAEQLAGGFRHTLREIWQQPDLWEVTADQIACLSERLRQRLAGANGILLTGSGSSQFAGECIAHPVQAATGIPTRVVSSGELLLLGREALPPLRPLLV